MRISTCRICKIVVVIALFSLTISLLAVFDFVYNGTKQEENSVHLTLLKRNYGRKLSVERGKQVVDTFRVLRKTNGVVESGNYLNKTPETVKNVNNYDKLQINKRISGRNEKNKVQKTTQSDIYISVKTTKSNRAERLQLLLDTWISLASDQTYIFTDNDKQIPDGFPSDHFINTDCANSHYRKGLCCKMGREYDVFMEIKKRWFCHVDDDNYVNMPALTKFLQKYNHSEDWYLGRPSISHPIEVLDRANPGLPIQLITCDLSNYTPCTIWTCSSNPGYSTLQQKLAFWFATGGAGFCISQGLARKMLPYAGGGRIVTTGDNIRLPDDCTIGYIINHQLKVPLTTIPEFHSHLEGLHRISALQLPQQLTFSYSNSNVIEVKGYSMEKDPTRFRTIHCLLYPSLSQCDDMPR